MNLRFRWQKYYADLGIIVCNTLILFGFINLGLWLVDIRRPQMATENQATQIVMRWLEEHRDQVPEVYPNYSDLELRQLINETWSRPYECEVFTHMREQPYAGKYVRVDPAGFRLGREHEQWPPSRQQQVVFVFGGSTTFGYGVADNETIPSFIQQWLQDKGKQVVVYNFGRGGYFSSQELVLFETLIREGVIPDGVVFIDGLNEFFHWSGKPGGVNLCGQMVEKKPFELPVMKLVRRVDGWLGKKLGMQQEENLVVIPEAKDKQVIDDVIKRWLHNKHMIEGVAEKYGIKVLFVWQPVPTYKYDLNYHLLFDSVDDFGPNLRSKYGYEAMEEIMKTRKEFANVMDLSGMGADRKEWLYVDTVHYSAQFSQEIADMIGKQIWLW